jgi:hypoxanthine phosphoribosyltransferase
VVVTAEQIQKRVAELARQISEQYRDKTLHAVCVLENGFIFMADLVRLLEIPVVCHFVRPMWREVALQQGTAPVTEIFFTPETAVAGQDVLLVEALVQSGQTSDFLMRNLVGRGASSVKLAALLDRHAARRVPLQVDYCGFVVDEPFVYGYGLGAPEVGRNLPYIAVAQGMSTTPPLAGAV